MNIDDVIRVFELIAQEFRDEIEFIDGMVPLKNTKRELARFEMAIEALEEKKEREINNPIPHDKLILFADTLYIL